MVTQTKNKMMSETQIKIVFGIEILLLILFTIAGYIWMDFGGGSIPN